MHILHTVLFTFPNVLKKGEFVRQSRALLVDDNFLYFCDHNFGFKGDNVILMLVTFWGQRVNGQE